jgi:hypothetical protein
LEVEWGKAMLKVEDQETKTIVPRVGVLKVGQEVAAL